MSSIWQRDIIIKNYVLVWLAYLCFTKHNIAVAVLGLVDIRGRDNEQHVLWPAEGDTCDARNFLQAQTKKSFPGLALWARLDFVEGRLGGGVLFVLRVVRKDFLDGSGHLKEAR